MSHLFFRHFHMNKKDIIIYDEEGIPTGDIEEGYLLHSLLQGVLAANRKFGASKKNPVVLCVDSKPSWRHTWYVENLPSDESYRGMTYKGKRQKDDTLPWDKIWDAYHTMLEMLEACSDFCVMKVDLAEADDIIAVLARRQDQMGEKAYVISSDKDFKQLMSVNVTVYDPIKGRIHQEFDVKHFMDIMLIIGDKSDNILPIKPRTKEKTAEKLLKDLDVLLQTNPVMREKYEFNKVLIDFDYIPQHVTDAILANYKGQEYNFNNMKMMTFCMKFRLKEIAKRIGEFKLGDQQIDTKLNGGKQSRTATQVASQTLEDFFDN